MEIVSIYAFAAGWGRGGGGAPATTPSYDDGHNADHLGTPLIYARDTSKPANKIWLLSIRFMSTEVALLIPTARTRMFTLFKHPSNPSRYEPEQVRGTKVKRRSLNEHFRRAYLSRL